MAWHELIHKLKKRDIGILDTAMTNDRLRSNVCYHELGHALMGMT